MSLPGELLAAALIGTGRAELPTAESLPPPLAGLRAELAARPPEEALLLLAGAAALYAAAGQTAAHLPAAEWRLPAYRPEGDKMPCSPAAARFLERALNQQDTTLLPELLTLLEQTGQRAPDDLLPHVLEHGAKIPRLRPSLIPVLGERGRWLAALNPAWRFAAVEWNNPRAWPGAWAADPAGRAPLAHTARRRDPNAARALIESTWRAEPETSRRELLNVLAISPSMADEPFLERALDDRDAQVRRRAAELLAHLPDSRLAARLTAAAGSILALKAGALNPVFPAAVDDGLLRDGVSWPVEPVRPNATRSTADWSRLLIQTVGAIPLAHWETRFRLDPAQIVRAAEASKWPRTLVTAFATAALRQENMAWADALLVADGYGERTGMLLPLLSPDDCFARLAALGAGQADSAVVFLRRWPLAWNEASGRRLIDFLAQEAAADPETRRGSTLRFLSRHFAHRCPPALAGYAAEAFQPDKVNKAWQATLRHVTTTLALRGEMFDAVARKEESTDFTDYTD